VQVCLVCLQWDTRGGHPVAHEGLARLSLPTRLRCRGIFNTYCRVCHWNIFENRSTLMCAVITKIWRFAGCLLFWPPCNMIAWFITTANSCFITSLYQITQTKHYYSTTCTYTGVFAINNVTQKMAKMFSFIVCVALFVTTDATKT